MSAAREGMPGGAVDARVLVVLDADSTLIDQEAIELLAEEAGSLEQVTAATERAMRGELDFSTSLRERVATLEGLGVGAIATAAERITPTRGAGELVDAVHARGGLVGVVSGGFHELLDPVAAALGLDLCLANRLEVDGDRLTGRVRGAIVDARAKGDALEEWAGAAGIPLSRTVAVGDGANDLEMLGRAALGIAFCAKPVVRARAEVAIVDRDLAQLLPLLGYRG